MLRLLLLALLLFPAAAQAQQIVVPRVEQMPALPQPYEMRDWSAVARRFDALAFDEDASGEYLPFVDVRSSGTNYPAHGAFGLQTYVGSRNASPGEAITALPALVGASLVGIDKRAQARDWVLFGEDYFNRRAEENVYLNAPSTRSGVDWWYETMPNVFFYQLYDLYGADVGDFAQQFTTVADRWLLAVEALGGSASPWSVPDLNHRAFALSTMTPLASGVKEPEAAGALAWLLYHAFTETGEVRYRHGAEQAMEFLAGLTSNPSYELQLPYGALAAAKMNAELGTRYDVEKLVNWTFEIGPLRQWGAVVGTWGGYDVDGLIGEVGTARGGYAFALNGFQQAAALAPLARYDDRFARSLGRWMLNVANASRLYYPGFLPSDQTHDPAWSAAHDPGDVVPYEALLRSFGGKSPFATGDAKQGGWAPTNLSLYSGASVGYLAAVVETTDVNGILHIDATATDFFGEGFPTALLYNPHGEVKTVTPQWADAEDATGSFDLYDATRDAFVARGVPASATVDVPADAAVLIVRIPAGRIALTDAAGRLRVSGRIVDYRTAASSPRARVKALVADAERLGPGETTALYCTGQGETDGETGGEALVYTWTAERGSVSGDGAQVTYTAPDGDGSDDVTCAVAGATTSASATISLSITDNREPGPPVITASTPTPQPGDTLTLTCAATDDDGDALAYAWTAERGAFDATTGARVTFTPPPGETGYFEVTCTASDPAGASSAAMYGVSVGDLVLHLPLESDAAPGAKDASGYANAGILAGAAMQSDALVGAASGGSASFDGVEAHVRVPNHPSLAFREGVTVHASFRADPFPNREQFLVSHGSWQNRWKLSITPERRLRWTVNTTGGITDLDAPAELSPGVVYTATATYDGATMRLYVGEAEVASQAHTGALSVTTVDLLLGQMLPGDTQYNFDGAMDEVRVYRRALDAGEVRGLVASVLSNETLGDGAALALGTPYPNPFATSVTIPVTLGVPTDVRMSVYDLLGRRVASQQLGVLGAGPHALTWDGLAEDGARAASGVYLVRVESTTTAAHARIVLAR